MARPTLYFDFDGVLHAGITSAADRFHRQSYLVQAIEGFELDIVISSSWRFQYTSERLKSLLDPAIGDRIVGITGDPLVGAYSRWREIERHAMFNRVREFRALDDSLFLFPPDCGALIPCEGSRGMGAEQSRAVRQWLQSVAA